MRTAVFALAAGLLLASACQKPTDTTEPAKASDPGAAPAAPENPAGAVAPAKAPGPEGLDEALALATSQLEGKKYREMLERFVAPQDRESALGEAGSWDKLADVFSQGKALELLERLQQAKGQKPEITPDGVRAIYPGKQDAAGIARKDLVWERVDGLWYLRN